MVFLQSHIICKITAAEFFNLQAIVTLKSVFIRGRPFVKMRSAVSRQQFRTLHPSAKIEPILNYKSVSARNLKYFGSGKSDIIGSFRGFEKLENQCEEDLLCGCGFQAIWNEGLDVSSLTSAALKFTRLIPIESDSEWSNSYSNFTQVYGLTKARLSRQLFLIQTRFMDAQSVLNEENKIREDVVQTVGEVQEATEGLSTAKKLRKNREEYDVLCSDILKKSSVVDIEKLGDLENTRRQAAESLTKDITERIALRHKQLEAAISVSGDLLI